MLTPQTSKITVIGQTLEIQQWRAADVPHAPTLVFLHEGLGSVAMWRDWPGQVCSQLRCSGLVYSRRGYGQSDAVPDVRGPSAVDAQGQRTGRLLPDYMHQEALCVLPALLQALGIERPVLVGHSDGGTIALIHASQFDVAGCMVMAPHVMVEDISIQAISAATQAYVDGPLRSRLSPYHADVDSAFWSWNDVWLSPAFRDFDIRPELERITAPMLAIQGEQDPYGSLAQIEDIALALPHTRLCVLPQCGHSPHRDQPAAVNQALAEFLAEL